MKNSKSKNGGRSIAIAMGVVVLAWILGIAAPLVKGRSPVDLGLDLAGGVRVTYRPDFTALGDEWAGADRAEILARAKETLASRLSRGATVVPDVVVRGDGRLVVSLPGAESRTEALEKIGRTYRLTFHLVEGEAATEAEGESEVAPETETEGVETFHYQDRDLKLGPVQFTGEMLSERSISARVGKGRVVSTPVVGFRFASPHESEFARFTGEHVGEELAILIDDEVFWVGRIQSRIAGPGSLQGADSMQEAEELARMLRSGSLPVPLEVESLSVVGSALGREVATEGARALGLSLVALAVLLGLAYLGRAELLVAALLSTLSLAVLISGMTAVFGLTLDLAGIAGLVLSVGMGMDAFLIVFERLASRPREEREGRFGPALAGLYSFAGEGRTLFHANATTLLVVALLLGSERLASFALFLIVGLLASVVNIFVTHRIVAWTGRTIPSVGRDVLARVRTAQPGLFRLRLVYGIAVLVGLLAVLGPGAIGGGPVGPGLGPEFRAGTQLIVSGTESSLEAALNAFAAQAPDATVGHRTLGEPEESRWLVSLDSPELAAAGNLSTEGTVTGGLQLEEILESHGLHLESLETIDSMLSTGRLSSSLRVLVFSFFLLALYFVAIEEPIDRFFRPAGGVQLSNTSRFLVFGSVLLAVVVDLAVVVAALTLLALPISLPVVAALLAIVGYSVNDSVVLWSHVQQGWEKRRRDRVEQKATPTQVVATAVDEILSRAVLTTVSTAVPAWAILVTGPEALRDFAWVIVVGTLSGTLSSLFVVGSAAVTALRREEEGRETSPSRAKREVEAPVT